MSKRPTHSLPHGSGRLPEEQRAILVALPAAALARMGGEAALRAKLNRIGAVGHPNCLHWLGHDAAAGRLVREWINGFTLRELRERRDVPQREVVELCARLPSVLAAMENAGLTIPQPLLGDVFMAFAPEIDPRMWLDRAVRDWPAFTVKVNPLPLAPGGDEASGDGFGTSTVALAGLVYDLLVGRDAPGVGNRPSVASLGQVANAVLQDSLSGKLRENSVEFWQRFVRSLEERTTFNPWIVSAAPCRAITVRPIGAGARATRVRFRPESKGALPIHVSARPYLRIGRGARLADVLTRFLPETLENVRMTNRLGRVHVLGRRVNGWPCFWDGDGRRASVNGTWLDEEQLDSEAGTRSGRESCLRLGREYRLHVTCVEEEPVGLDPAGETLKTSIGHNGCTVILTVGGHSPARLFAWLGASVGLQFTAQGLAWNYAGATHSDVALLHSGGGFWLANLALPAPSMSIDGVPLAAGHAVGLQPGQEVVVGTTRYRVRTED